MKKFIALFLALALLASLSVTAFAAEDEYAGTGESTVYAHVYSQYNITIPATIDLREGEQGEVTLSNASLEEGYAVNVYVTNKSGNGISLMHTNGISTVECMLTNIELNMQASDTTPLVSFKLSDIPQDSSTAIKYFELSTEKYGMPGDYSGTLQYRFVCEPIAD